MCLSAPLIHSLSHSVNKRTSTTWRVFCWTLKMTTADVYSPEKLVGGNTLTQACPRCLYDLGMETNFKFQILTRLTKALGLGITYLLKN